MVKHSKATYNRKYKPIKACDKVIEYLKPKSMKKGNVSVRSEDVYTITPIKDKQYLINDHRQRVWNRWELLRIVLKVRMGEFLFKHLESIVYNRTCQDKVKKINILSVRVAVVNI